MHFVFESVATEVAMHLLAIAAAFEWVPQMLSKLIQLILKLVNSFLSVSRVMLHLRSDHNPFSPVCCAAVCMQAEQ